MKGLTIILLLAVFAICISFEESSHAQVYNDNYPDDDRIVGYERRYYSDRGDRAAEGAFGGAVAGTAIGGAIGGGRGAGIGFGAGLLGGALIGGSAGTDYYYDEPIYADDDDSRPSKNRYTRNRSARRTREEYAD